MASRLLVLGGGQLGLMMAEAAARLGLVVDRYDPERNVVIPGTSDMTVTLDADHCLARYAAITAEREAFPDSGASRFLAHSDKCVTRTALEVLPDRLPQKQLLDRLGIATSPWQPLNAVDDLAAFRQQHGDAVIKARTGGYDGRGLWMVDSDSSDAPVAELCKRAIVEKKIPFEREVSVVGARNRTGQMVFYPLVRNWHVDGILRLTLAPARAVSAELQAEAEQALARLMEHLEYVGVMAVEFFQHNGHLLVNEIAPRVHNSGHWSQEGTDLGQFELHVRALAGLPMHSPTSVPFAAMVNLIGVAFDDAWLSRPGTLHWYGKDVRPGRKLGHVNLVADSAAELREALASWSDVLPEHWQAQFDNEQGS